MQEEAPARFPEPCRIGGIDMGQWGFWFDQQDCINCHTCEIACKVWNEQKRGDARLYPLRELTGGTAGENAVERNYYMKERLRRSWYEERGNKPPDLMRYNMNISCNHCSKPACIDACPTGRIYKEDTYGIVLANEEIPCISCGRCQKACPWEAPQFYTILKERPVMVKCDLCMERIVTGLNPACVAACPMRALEAGELKGLKERHSEDYTEQAIGLERGNTDPNIIFRKRGNTF